MQFSGLGQDSGSGRKGERQGSHAGTWAIKKSQKAVDFAAVLGLAPKTVPEEKVNCPSRSDKLYSTLCLIRALVPSALRVYNPHSSLSPGRSEEELRCPDTAQSLLTPGLRQPAGGVEQGHPLLVATTTLARFLPPQILEFLGQKGPLLLDPILCCCFLLINLSQTWEIL